MSLDVFNKFEGGSPLRMEKRAGKVIVKVKIAGVPGSKSPPGMLYFLTKVGDPGEIPFVSVWRAAVAVPAKRRVGRADPDGGGEESEILFTVPLEGFDYCIKKTTRHDTNVFTYSAVFGVNQHVEHVIRSSGWWKSKKPFPGFETTPSDQANDDTFSAREQKEARIDQIVDLFDALVYHRTSTTPDINAVDPKELPGILGDFSRPGEARLWAGHCGHGGLSPQLVEALAGKKHRNKIAAAANLPPWNAEQERALKDDDPWSSWKFRRSDQATLLTAIPYTHFARVAPSHGLMQAFYPPYFVDTIPYDDFFAVIGQAHKAWSNGFSNVSEGAKGIEEASRRRLKFCDCLALSLYWLLAILGLAGAGFFAGLHFWWEDEGSGSEDGRTFDLLLTIVFAASCLVLAGVGCGIVGLCSRQRHRRVVHVNTLARLRAADAVNRMLRKHINPRSMWRTAKLEWVFAGPTQGLILHSYGRRSGRLVPAAISWSDSSDANPGSSSTSGVAAASSSASASGAASGVRSSSSSSYRYS